MSYKMKCPECNRKMIITKLRCLNCVSAIEVDGGKGLSPIPTPCPGCKALNGSEVMLVPARFTCTRCDVEVNLDFA